MVLYKEPIFYSNQNYQKLVSVLCIFMFAWIILLQI